MPYLAHSACPDQGIPAQGYGEHARASRDWSCQYAEDAGRYSRLYGDMLVATATLAGEFHDLGKLDDRNQEVLAGNVGGKLPVPHTDAGTAHLLKRGDQASMYAALLCRSHHIGLPSMPHERNRGAAFLRFETRAPNPQESERWQTHTDIYLGEYLRKHRECLEEVARSSTALLKTNQLQLLWRFALSCQADADHGDTSRHYGDTELKPSPPIRAEERLAALDAYVAGLSNKDNDGPRNQLRQAIYQACRQADASVPLYACDAPVGSGKTTAVMAHLLKAACDKGLRRVIVVLPFTNIITQAVEVYRKAIVLEGEDPEEIVAEHHHRADYSAPDSRRFAMLWNAPIVVTTAVQFFETLASNMPADLRKLHRLPGSAVFFDEAHAALPAHLWPQAWLWLQELAEQWGCHLVFASGSLSRFWELPDFHPENSAQEANPPKLPELVADSPRNYAQDREKARVAYKAIPTAMGLDELVRRVNSHQEGPRLVVVNTVQSAAVVARAMSQRFGCGRVEHLSTALTPADREITLSRVKQRLKRSSDPNWTLVATSCVEAGVDLSFGIGFRERASLMSLIQLGGRVNREHDSDNAEVWDFQIKPDNLLRLHPKLKTPARVLAGLFDENKVAPEYCKEALRREVRWNNANDAKELLKAESSSNSGETDFPKVAELFKVIDAYTVTVVIAPALQEQLRQGRWCGRDALQKHSVQIWGWRIDELSLKEFPKFPGLYGWPLSYDAFLGYMAGLLPVIEFSTGRPTVV